MRDMATATLPAGSDGFSGWRGTIPGLTGETGSMSTSQVLSGGVPFPPSLRSGGPRPTRHPLGSASGTGLGPVLVRP